MWPLELKKFNNSWIDKDRLARLYGLNFIACPVWLKNEGVVAMGSLLILDVYGRCSPKISTADLHCADAIKKCPEKGEN